MGMSRVTYNDWTFPDRSQFSCQESFVYDDAGVTVVKTQFNLQVQTIICVENPSPGASYDASDYDCGNEMHLLRQRLSKAGQSLKIEHDGFGPRMEINGYSNSTIKDVSWGPTPKMISWEPIGHTRSVEVVWQCEFCIPICDGRTGSPAFTGLSALNYSVGFSFDSRGFTTRRISGYIEIALTRDNRNNPRGLVDSVDNYRNKLAVSKPANFEREVSWDISTDKRRANFSIIDKEISSPNAWPPGVVKIQGTHRVGWSRSNLTRVSNSISVSIEMAPDQLKARAWLIFADIVKTRQQFAPAPSKLLIQSLDIVEELYENKVSFQMGYTFTAPIDLARLFADTGLFQPIAFRGQQPPTWETWDESVKHLQPLRGNGTDGGIANLRHEYQYDKIVDLCDNTPRPGPPQDLARGVQQASYAPLLSNATPPPNSSWLKFDASIGHIDRGTAIATIQLGPNNKDHDRFNPAEPTAGGANLSRINGTPLKEYFQEHGTKEHIVWSGYAERIGYPVPKPGQMKFAGVWLRPVPGPRSSNGAFFEQKFMGMHFGVPKYAASWRQYYKLNRVPTVIPPKLDVFVQGDTTQFNINPSELE